MAGLRMTDDGVCLKCLISFALLGAFAFIAQLSLLNLSHATFDYISIRFHARVCLHRWLPQD